MKFSSILTISAASICFIACTETKTSTATDRQQIDQTESTDEASVERDSLIALFNNINEDILQIKEMESIISMPSNLRGENGKSAVEMRDGLLAIQQTLQIRRQKLDELEKKLSVADKQNAELLKMVENMKAQMEESNKTIADLTQQLAEANNTITTLNSTVDSLNNSVAVATAEKNQTEQRNKELIEEVNKCFYVIGSKKELKEHKIIETGFLRKTKIMQGDYESSYFTQVDRRSLTVIPLDSKKAKVLTNQPSDSYSITTDASGMKSLNIMNPSKFWATGNYLVVQTD